MALGSAINDYATRGAGAALIRGLRVQGSNLHLKTVDHREQLLLDRLPIAHVLDTYAGAIETQLLGRLAVLLGHGSVLLTLLLKLGRQCGLAFRPKRKYRHNLGRRMKVWHRDVDQKAGRGVDVDGGAVLRLHDFL